MARIRSIKPEFATDGKIKRLSDTTALFFILLWNHCDDYGYFEVDTLELATRTSRWRSQDIMRMLRALHEAGLVRLSLGHDRVMGLSSQAHGLGMIASWQHQRVDKPRPSKWKDMEIQWDDASPIQDQNKTDRRKDRIGKDRIGKDRIGSEGVQAPAPAPIEKPVTSETWEAYSNAYEQRYMTPPVRNAAINGMLSNLVKRLGKEEAPQVAAFYVTHNNQYYVTRMHDVKSLLADAEKLRTEWATGTRMTATAARGTDRQARVMDQIARVRRGEL